MQRILNRFLFLLSLLVLGAGHIHAQSLSAICTPILNAPIAFSCPQGQGFSLVSGSYVKLNVNSNAVVNGTVSDNAAQFVGVPLRIVQSNVIVQTTGAATLNFDGATTSGDTITMSTTTAGYFHDTGGTTCSTTTLGVVNQAIGSAGQAVAFLGPCAPSKGGGSGGGGAVGPDGAVQLSDGAGAFDGSSALTFDPTGLITDGLQVVAPGVALKMSFGTEARYFTILDANGNYLASFQSVGPTNSHAFERNALALVGLSDIQTYTQKNDPNENYYLWQRITADGSFELRDGLGSATGPDVYGSVYLSTDPANHLVNIDGGLDVNGHSAFGSGATIDMETAFRAGDFGDGFPATISVYESGLAGSGLLLQNDVTDASPDSTTEYYGAQIGTYATPGRSTSMDALDALYAASYYQGTGHVGTVSAIIPDAEIFGNGATADLLVAIDADTGAGFDGSNVTVTTVDGIRVRNGLDSGSTAGTMRGIHVQSPNSGGTVSGANYGALIDEQNFDGTLNFGIYSGPAESTLPALLQGYAGSYNLFTYNDLSGGGHAGLGVELAGNGDTGLYSTTLGTANAISGDSYINADGQTVGGGAGNFRVSANGHAGLDLIALELIADLDDGSADVMTALKVRDVVGADANYQYKGGAGMFEVGDAGKTVMLHILGAAPFVPDLNAGPSLWVDTDSDAYAEILSNRTAGVEKWTGIYVDNLGGFFIGPNGDSGSEFGYVLDADSWVFNGGAKVAIGPEATESGLHIQGAGAFDVDGFGTTSQLWLDGDDVAGPIYTLALTNRTAGIEHATGIFVGNNGSFNIQADDGGGNLFYSVADSKWTFFNNNSVTVSGWISTERTTAPDDADIEANELADWFDPTNGAAFARFKGKTANGTVVNAGFGMNTVSAPSPSTIVLPTSVYGGSAQLLGGPTAWASEIINGTAYKIPLY